MTDTEPTPTVVDGVTIYTRPIAYTVSAAPEDPYDGNLFALKVEYTGAFRWAEPRPEDQQWAVRMRSHWCLSKSKKWDMESIPSEREDDWLLEHRFDLPTALRLAAEMAPTVSINGLEARDYLAYRTRRDARRDARQDAET